MIANQLTLPLIPLPEDETLDSFYPKGNEMSLYAIRQLLVSDEFASLYLWGSNQSGKTHLLHGACAHHNQLSLPTVFLPLKHKDHMMPEMLEGLESLSLICIDDIQYIAGDRLWEEAVFDLFNRVKEQGLAQLLITGDQPPRAMGISLPDLISRLSWGGIYQLSALDDEAKLLALKHRANLRGFELPQEVALFLVNRVDRNLTTLFDVLDTLDRASLSEKRLISIPFVKKVLSL